MPLLSITTTYSYLQYHNVSLDFMRAMLATSMARIKTRANPSHKRVESIFVQRAIILFAIFAELHNKTYCLSNVPPTVVF